MGSGSFSTSAYRGSWSECRQRYFYKLLATPPYYYHTFPSTVGFFEEAAIPTTDRGIPEFHASKQDTVRHFRGLGDVDILKSYFLFIWSEWSQLSDVGGMLVSIREDFGGIGMGHHRDDLIKRLDHVLGQLDRGLDYLEQHQDGL
jgi:hypothetical protein